MTTTHSSNILRFKVKSIHKEEGYPLNLEEAKAFLHHDAFRFLDFSHCKFNFSHNENPNLGIGSHLVDINLINEVEH